MSSICPLQEGSFLHISKYSRDCARTCSCRGCHSNTTRRQGTEIHGACIQRQHSHLSPFISFSLLFVTRRFLTHIQKSSKQAWSVKPTSLLRICQHNVTPHTIFILLYDIITAATNAFPGFTSAPLWIRQPYFIAYNDSVGDGHTGKFRNHRQIYWSK
jgi:hypothetical protein